MSLMICLFERKMKVNWNTCPELCDPRSCVTFSQQMHVSDLDFWLTSVHLFFYLNTWNSLNCPRFSESFLLKCWDSTLSFKKIKTSNFKMVTFHCLQQSGTCKSHQQQSKPPSQGQRKELADFTDPGLFWSSFTLLELNFVWPFTLNQIILWHLEHDSCF